MASESPIANALKNHSSASVPDWYCRTQVRLSHVLTELSSVDYETAVRHDDMLYVMRLWLNTLQTSCSIVYAKNRPPSSRPFPAMVPLIHFSFNSTNTQLLKNLSAWECGSGVGLKENKPTVLSNKSDIRLLFKAFKQNGLWHAKRITPRFTESFSSILCFHKYLHRFIIRMIFVYYLFYNSMCWD